MANDETTQRILTAIENLTEAIKDQATAQGDRETSAKTLETKPKESSKKDKSLTDLISGFTKGFFIGQLKNLITGVLGSITRNISQTFSSRYAARQGSVYEDTVKWAKDSAAAGHEVSMQEMRRYHMQRHARGQIEAQNLNVADYTAGNTPTPVSYGIDWTVKKWNEGAARTKHWIDGNSQLYKYRWEGK